jgi:hypothetical protein
MVGNTVMTAPPGDPSAVKAQNGVGSKINNNDFNMAFIDVNQHSTTSDSSSATPSLPAGRRCSSRGNRLGVSPDVALVSHAELVSTSEEPPIWFGQETWGIESCMVIRPEAPARPCAIPPRAVRAADTVVGYRDDGSPGLRAGCLREHNGERLRVQ